MQCEYILFWPIAMLVRWLRSGQPHACRRGQPHKKTRCADGTGPLQLSKPRKLGEGTYSRVYLKNGNAVKRVLLEPSRGIPFTSIREADIMLSLRHKNVMELLGAAVIGRSFEITMPFCPSTLEDVIGKDHPSGAPLPVVLAFARQLLSALAYVHSQCVVHRDVKPANLLLSHDGELKLSDFGLARRVYPGEQRLLTHEVVTIWYRPPELMLSDQYAYDATIDVWSFGCVLYELSTGKPLFPYKRERRMLSVMLAAFGREVLSSAFPRESFASSPSADPAPGTVFDPLDADVRQLVLAALVCDPARRPSCSALLQAMPMPSRL